VLDGARAHGGEPGAEKVLGESGGAAAGNRLLSLPPEAVREALARHVRILVHAPGSTLFEAEDVVDTLVFPAEGTVLSLLVPTPGAKPVESTMVGSEGAAGAVLGPIPVPAMVRCEVLVGGRAIHIPASDFHAAIASAPGVARALMARYAAALVGNLHQAVACAALHPVEARAGRWILSAQDRLGSRAAVPMTQEVLADRLGVRRTTVTRVIAQLEARGAIQHRRGRVHVLDRAALEATSCPCYAAQRRRLEAVHPDLYPRPGTEHPALAAAPLDDLTNKA
jgi:CRP-like cAMP-binding protein